MDILFERLENLNPLDMKRQCEFIETSLDLMSDKTERYLNKIYFSKEEPLKNGADDKEIKNLMLEMKQRILESGVWNREKTEISWYSVNINFHERLTWSIRFMDVYLYEGLAGMLLIMAALKQAEKDPEVEDIYRALKKQLFRYTESGLQSLKNLQSKSTGAYTGESSIVYTYLALYQFTREDIYLEYGKMHSRIVEKLVEEDTNYDLLFRKCRSGTGDAEALRSYRGLALCQRGGKSDGNCGKSSKKQEKGIGWNVKADIPPMSGMAHGNAGMMMPVMLLWKITGNKKYEALAEEIWQYEEFLYDEKEK